MTGDTKVLITLAVLGLILCIAFFTLMLNNRPTYLSEIKFERSLLTPIDIVIPEKQIEEYLSIYVYKSDYEDLLNKISSDVLALEGQISKNSNKSFTIVAPEDYVSSLVDLNDTQHTISIYDAPYYAEWLGKEKSSSGKMTQVDIVINVLYLDYNEVIMLIWLIAAEFVLLCFLTFVLWKTDSPKKEEQQ